VLLGELGVGHQGGGVAGPEGEQGLALAATTSRPSDTRIPWPATQRTSSARDGAPGRFRLWFPYLPVMVAAAVGLPMALPHLNNPAAVGAVVLILVLLARQLVTLSDNQRLLHSLDHLAHHDPLTGLANRTRFHHRLDQAL
jgi:diguanylate cyclase